MGWHLAGLRFEVAPPIKAVNRGGDLVRLRIGWNKQMLLVPDLRSQLLRGCG